MKVLLPVDGSVYTKRMLAYLAAHDELVGPDNDFTAFTVVTRLPGEMVAHLPADLLQSYLDDEAQEVLRPIASFAHQRGWRLQTRSAVGIPAEQIERFVDEEKFDLIVMGSHGRSAIANLALGSVAMRVIARTRPPVLVVR